MVSARQAIDFVCAQLRFLGDDGIPYALLGYSMGSLIAYVVGVELVRQGKDAPICLFAVAEAGPGQVRPDVNPRLDDAKMANALLQIGQLSEEAYNAGPEIWKTILGTYRADLFLEESLVDFISDYPPIECDVSVIYGEHDPAFASWDAARMESSRNRCL